MAEYTIIDPQSGEPTVIYSNDEEQVHGVDVEGNYLGLVPKGTEFLHINNPPSNPRFTWDFATSSWVNILTLDEEKDIALAYIDNLAGSTRLRFITEVPGQQAVYMTKLEECKAYLLDNSVIGSYLQAEANVTGQSLLETANYIVAVSAYWNNVIGPSIESTRRKSKIDISAAVSVAEVISIKELAKTSLDAL